MADAGLPWSIPNAGFSIQPINGEFAAWSRGSSVPPDGWSVLSGTWSATLSRCQGGTGPHAVDFGQAGIPSTLVSDYIVVLPNTRYLLSALYRIVTGSGAALSQGVRVDWYDDSRSLISSNNVDLITNTAGVWTYSGLDITSPIQAVYAKVVVGRFNVNGSTNLQVDAIKLDRAVYIPSGVISLDDVTDGVTYARPRGAYMSGGIINAVVRGAGTVATDFLFKKPNIIDPDTLDGIPNGTTYGRPKLDALTVAGYPDLDKVVDGATYGRVKNTMLTSGEVTSLARGGTVYATSTFFQKALDNLGNILDGGGFRRTADTYVDSSGRVTGVLRGTSQLTGLDLFSKALDSLDNVLDGTTYGRPKLDGLNASGYPLLDKVVDGALFRRVGVGYVNASGQITAIRNTTGGGADIPGTAVFSKSVDTLDNVTDGTSFARVSAITLSGGVVQTIKYGTGTFATGSLFRKATDTLDDMAEGTTYKRLVAGSVTSGYPSSVYRDGAPLATSGLFKVNSNTLDDMAEGTTYKRLVTGAVTSGYPSSVYRDGAPLATSSLFKKSSDTFASVAGTLADGQLGSNVVNTSNIKDGNITTAKVADLGITYGKLDNGPPFQAWDEGRSGLLNGRVTSVVNGTITAPEVGDGYLRFTPTTSTTDFYFLTNIQFRTNKDLFAVVTYRCSNTGWKATDTIRLYNIANTAQNTTATMIADGNWHTAIFNISAFTGTGTIRFDFQDSGQAINAGATLDVSYAATGLLGSSGSVGVSGYRGFLGVGVAVPAVPLEVLFAASSGWTAQLVNSSNAANTTKTIGLEFRGTDTSSTEKQAALIRAVPADNNYVASGLSFSTRTADAVAERMIISGAGNVTINKPTSGVNLTVTGTDGAVSTIISTSGTASAFPQQQVINYNATGGYPVLAYYNSRGTVASPVALSASDTLGGVAFYGRGTSSFFIGAQIRAIATAAPATAITSALAFETSNNSFLGPNERMRIHPGGAVGINTTATESLAELAVKGIANGNADFLLVEGDTSNGWNLAALVSDDSFRLARFVSPGTYTDVFTALTSGFVGINTVTPQERLHVVGNIRNSALAGVGNRTVYSDANGTLTNVASDATLKEDIQPLENALPVVMKMNPVSFSWRDQERFGPYTEVGFLAQEMLELVPFVVGKNADDTFTIDYPKLTAVLARAIQELKQQVDELASSRS